MSTSRTARASRSTGTCSRARSCTSRRTAGLIHVGDEDRYRFVPIADAVLDAFVPRRRPIVEFEDEPGSRRGCWTGATADADLRALRPEEALTSPLLPPFALPLSALLG